MTLQCTKPGLWEDDAYRPGEPGTFALVVGVSAYAHLDGGPAPARQTYRLPQLAVSALTAMRFFEWLRRRYAFHGAPLARCWLLLSPTAAERIAGPITDGDYAPADYAGMETAITEWFATLEQLPAPAAKASRAFFCFSGHGLELTQESQVLLPSDYLRPPAEQRNRAPSTDNIRYAMRRLQAKDQFFFLDACRNGGETFGAAAVMPHQVLNVEPPTANNSAVRQALLYATASGSRAWQQPSPERGLSMFGQALLDGLHGGAPVREDEPPPAIWFNQLTSYTSQRVRTLLKEAGATQDQPVKGWFEELPVVQVVAPGGVPEPLPTADELLAAPRGDVHLGAGAPLHDYFGSEQIEALWNGAQLLDLATGAPLPAGLLTPVQGERLGVHQHWVRIQPSLSDPAWLELTVGDTRYAAVLPGFSGARYELGFQWEWDPNRQLPLRLLSFDVDLVEGGSPALNRAAELWRRYRRVHAADAASAIIDATDAAAAQETVRRKTAYPDSPLAAVVAALLLLRTGQAGRLNDWLGNLTTWFPWLPDAPVLWAEQQIRLGANAATDPLDAFLLLADRPALPFTVEAFGYALAMGQVFTETVPDTDPRAAPVRRLHARLAGASALVRTGGLFLTLAGPAPDVVPALVRTG